MVWVGVDDTDSLRGYCTTFLATELVSELTEDFDLIGYPRLVRLNPNIPWKTRGNGAVAFRIGRGRGEPFQIGSIGGRDQRAYPRGVPASPDEALEARLSRGVEHWSDLEAEGTNPGLVLLRQKPAPALYWEAVRGIVRMNQAHRAVRGRGRTVTWKSGRGIIGAAAACAWRPHDRTWEVIAYRDPSRWGTVRQINAPSVRRMDKSFPSTFNNYDYASERVVIAPSTPCPVLFGIRGDDPDVLPAAMRAIRGETPERWLLYETNQGTDDHVMRGPASEPRTAGIFTGTVRSWPRTIRGGHVVFRLDAWAVAAYEPSKQFRDTVRRLAPGDRVRAMGSLRETPRTVNLEKLLIERLTSLQRKTGNPRCPACGVRMKSTGHDAPYRCRKCGRRRDRGDGLYTTVRRDISPGWYEPPVGSRRHLSRPLRRGLRYALSPRLGRS